MCASGSLWLGSSLSHCGSDTETGSLWPGVFALCHHVACLSAHKQMVPSAMFALGSISPGLREGLAPCTFLCSHSRARTIGLVLLLAAERSGWRARRVQGAYLQSHSKGGSADLSESCFSDGT